MPEIKASSSLNVDIRYPGIPKFYLTKFKDLRGTDAQLLFVLIWWQHNFDPDYAVEAYKQAGFTAKNNAARVKNHPAVLYLKERLTWIDPVDYIELLRMAGSTLKTILEPKSSAEPQVKVQASRLAISVATAIEERDLKQQRMFERAKQEDERSRPKEISKERAEKTIEMILDAYPELRERFTPGTTEEES